MYDSRDFSTLPLHGTRGKHSSYLAKLCRAFWLLIPCTQTYLAVRKTQKPRRRKTSSIYGLDYLLARTTAVYFGPFSLHRQPWWLWAVSLNSTSSNGRTAKRLWELGNPQDIGKTSISFSHSKPNSEAYMQYIRNILPILNGVLRQRPNGSDKFTSQGERSLLQTFSPWSLKHWPPSEQAIWEIWRTSWNLNC